MPFNHMENPMKDLVAKRLWDALYKDFSHVDPSVALFAKAGAEALGNSFSVFRKFSFPTLDETSVGTYKRAMQLEHMFDRFIADSDDRQQRDLDTEALQGFLDGQSNVLTGLPGSMRAHMLLKEMRRVVKLMLGEVPKVENLVDWRVSSKASVGVTREKGYLHEKLDNLSGTAEQHKLLRQMLGGCLWKTRRCLSDHVTASAVPKKWNKARIISADTVASGILSNAVGNYISSRLVQSVGINIKTQQHMHRRLMKYASSTGMLATLDLSAASDSFSLPLMRRVLPSGWYRLLKKIRIRKVGVCNKVISLQSFMTMGVGFTFPLQTLLFYAVIQSVKNLLRSTMPHAFPGIISVYGDDCVFPTSLYPYVVQCLNDLGFRVNNEKSFFSGFFRESCGEDCYKGVSVRPTFLKWKFQDTACNLYVFLNGILRRFNRLEIPETYKYITELLYSTDGEVLLVPPSYPDYAGLHCSSPDFMGDEHESVNYSLITRFSIGDEKNDKDKFGCNEGYCFWCKTVKGTGQKLITNRVSIWNHYIEKLRPTSDDQPFKKVWVIPTSLTDSPTNVAAAFRAVHDIHCHTQGSTLWKNLRFGKGKVKGDVGAGPKRRDRNPRIPAMLIPKRPKPKADLMFESRVGVVPFWA